MAGKLRVLIEEAPKGKRWVAIAGDWPGLERNGKSEDEAVAKLMLVPASLRACRADAPAWTLSSQADPDATIVERHTGTGSTDFWGISFAPSGEDREPLDDADVRPTNLVAARRLGRVR